MNRGVLWILLALFVLVQSIPSPSNLLLVYVSNWPDDDDANGVQDSLQIAQYYSSAYGVPANMLLGITLTNSTIFESYSTFYTDLVAPLNTKITALGKQNVEAITLIYPMPWKIDGYSGSVDSLIWFPSVFTSSSSPPAFYTATNLLNTMMESTPDISTDKGRFSASQDFTYYGVPTDIYPVTRIDGPGRLWGITARISAARYANKYVWYGAPYQNGNLYIDNTGDSPCGINTDKATLYSQTSVTSGSFTTAADADANIACGAYFVPSGNTMTVRHQGCSSKIIGETGVPNFVDGTSALSAPSAQAYGGWSALSNYKPDAWDWLPGSIGCDLNSGSLNKNIRSAPFLYSWAWGALVDGLTATAGAISDPGTEAHPRPNVMLYYYLRGYTFAEVALLSVPSFAWKSLYIGDPLLNPFSTTKTPIVDITPPSFAAGSPFLYYSYRTGYIVNVTVDESAGPEIVKATINWGTTPAMGKTIVSSNWAAWHEITFTELPQATLIYYQVTIQDPVGLTATSIQQSWTTVHRDIAFVIPSDIPGWVFFNLFDEGGEGLSYHDLDYEIMPGQTSRTAYGVEFNEPNFQQNMYPMSKFYPGEWVGQTSAAGIRGLYNVTLVADPFGTGSGWVQLTVDDVNVTAPFFAAQGISTSVYATIGDGYVFVKFRCIQPTDPEVGCGDYSHTIWEWIALQDSPSPTPSATMTPTPTATPTVTPSNSPSRSPSVTPTISPGASPSRSPSKSPSNSRSPSTTPSPVSPSTTPSVTPTSSTTPSVTPSISVSPSITPTLSPSPSNSRSPSGTASPTRTPPRTSSTTPSPTNSPTPSVTPTVTPTSSPSGTPTPTSTPSSSRTPTASATPTVTPSITPSVTPSSSVTPSETPSNSVTPTVSPSMNVLTITKDSGFPVIPVAAALGGAVGCCLFLLFAFVIIRKTKKKKDVDDKEDNGFDMADIDSGMPLAGNEYGPIGSPTGGSAQSMTSRGMAIDALKSEWIINFAEIKITSKIGAGAFGEVYKGNWRGVAIAVKQLYATNRDSSEENDIEEFFAEAELMQKLRPHPNITLLLGVCTNPLCIVTEFVSNGSLSDWLAAKKTLDAKAKVEIMKGTAAGILQLHSQGVVHRDLAARNILLDSTLKPKVADFGMSRVALGNSDKTKADTGPIKWMAPEALLSRIYNAKTDVWSYGVVIYEILTEGQPYPKMMATEVAVQILAGNLSLVPEIEQNATKYPAVLVHLLKRCLQTDAQNRPDFKDIVATFD